MFSKFTAPAVLSVITAGGLVLSLKLNVSVPEPPSSLARLTLANVCIPPASEPNIGETKSSPAPMSILSPLTNLAELIVSLPAPRLTVRSPPI